MRRGFRPYSCLMPLIASGASGRSRAWPRR
jgi:hypothetical protein